MIIPSTKNTFALIVNLDGEILGEYRVIAWAETIPGALEPVVYSDAAGQGLSRSRIIEQLGDVDVATVLPHEPQSIAVEKATKRIANRRAQRESVTGAKAKELLAESCLN